MDEIHSTPGRCLSQSLDPITRLASDLVSSSAPCSTHLGVHVHESCISEEGGLGLTPSGPDDPRKRSNAHDLKRIGLGSPRLMPRRTLKAPVPPPPRPLNTKGSTTVLPRDSPYVNVSNLIFRNNDSFAQGVRNAGYVELKDTSSNSSSSGSNCSKSCKYSPHDFNAEPRGHMEYADKRIFKARTDCSAKYLEIKVSDTQYPNFIHSTCDPGSSGRVESFKRSFSSCSKQYQDEQSRHYPGESQLFMDRTSLSSSTAEEKKKPNVTYSGFESCDGFSNTVEEFNWQEKCLELQLELHRSRTQATRIRDMLQEKISELEQRVLEAEGRAGEAEDKIAVFHM